MILQVYWQSQGDADKLRRQGEHLGDEGMFINATETFVVEEVQKLNLGITHIWIR